MLETSRIERIVEGFHKTFNRALTPSRIVRDQIISKTALRRSSKPGLGLFEVILEVRRFAVRCKSGFIAVDLVEIKPVWIVTVLENVEAQAAGLVLF